MPLYNRLREYRTRLGVNQQEMGDLVGVSRQTISQIERRECSPSLLLALKIARVCHARVEDIFSYQDEEGERTQHSEWQTGRKRFPGKNDE